jgi:hypothetical protein
MSTTTTTTTKQQFVSREVPKKDLQGILKAMRNHPSMTVEKLNSGYEVTDSQGNLALRAMNGNYAYLVRFNKGWFSHV